MSDDDARTLASGCAGQLLSARPNEVDAIYHAGVILALVAISDALAGISDAIAPVPADEPVPIEETKQGWSWP